MESELEFLYIGWCHGKQGDTLSDKVWTAFKAGDAYYAGWGRRGKSLSFKKHDSSWALRDLIRKKEKKYDEVDTFQLFTIFPYFKEEVEKRLTFCILTNKIR